MAIDPQTYTDTYGELPHLNEIAPVEPLPYSKKVKEWIEFVLYLITFFVIGYIITLPIVSGMMKH